MKIRLLFLFLLINTFKIYAQEHVKYDDDNGLPDKTIQKNKIKTINVYAYKIKSNSVDSNLVETDNFKYDTAGNMTEQESLPEAEVLGRKKLGQKQTFTYNKLNQVIKTESVYIKDNSHPERSAAISIEEFEYDKFGRVIVKYGYNKDTTWLKIDKMGYNDKGLLDTVLTKINKAPYMVDRVYGYDSNDRLISVDKKDAKQKISFSYLMSYDDAEHSKTTFLNNESGSHFQEKIIYNNDSQIIKRLSYSAFNNPDNSNNNPDTVEKYFYNPDGTLNSSLFYINGKVQQMKKLFYKR